MGKSKYSLEANIEFLEDCCCGGIKFDTVVIEFENGMCAARYVASEILSSSSFKGDNYFKHEDELTDKIIAWYRNKNNISTISFKIIYSTHDNREVEYNYDELEYDDALADYVNTVNNSEYHKIILYKVIEYTDASIELETLYVDVRE